MNTNSITVLTPEHVASTFNAWVVVAALIGGVIWHAILKAWPVVQKVYPWVVEHRGIGPILGNLFYVPKEPEKPYTPIPEVKIEPPKQ